jgi:Na+-transporting NADH:ubiquinone oxidoreductase subunit A
VVATADGPPNAPPLIPVNAPGAHSPYGASDRPGTRAGGGDGAIAERTIAQQTMALHRNSKGLDLPIAGAPAMPSTANLTTAAVSHVALLGADSPGLKPTMLVEPGARVLRGTPLYEDKKSPGVIFTAPAAGTVVAVNRGTRRAFVSLVIEIGPEDADYAHNHVVLASRDASAGHAPGQLDRETVRALLLESGLWTALRTRPFSHVASPAAAPAAIFITAIDTRPHAPPPSLALAGREVEFAAGLQALLTLTDGEVIVCHAPQTNLVFPPVARLRAEQFDGPHPAGNVGWHIHTLRPVDLDHSVWHIGYADVLAIGHLIRTGRLDVERVVSIAGPGIVQPRIVRTRLGASLDELTSGNLQPGEQRVISGSVLDGRAARGDVDGYLGRYHLQVSALPEGREREMFGYIAPGADKYSVSRVVLGSLLARLGARRFAFTTATNGGPRAMVPIGHYERVLPFDVAPTFLLRALIMRDDERAMALGALELDEEDLALATYVCPGKTEYGPLLRAALERIEKEH